MPDEPIIGLDDAYGVETPDDNRALYGRWASTYDTGFIEPRGYIYHEVVVELFVERGGRGPVLDVGCGTGVGGPVLRAAGIAPVDGVDLSPEMLAEAGRKVTADDDTVYRQLIEADLTQPIPLPDGSYAGVVSSGLFTHGHLGPEPLVELYRLAAVGAWFAIGINTEHFAALGFDRHLDSARAAGRISDHELIETRIYSNADDEHADSTALVALFRRTAAPG